MESQLFIAAAIKLDAHPAAHAHIRRPLKFLWLSFDERLLNANSRGYHYCDMSIVVMVIGKHREDLFAHKPGRFAVRQFFCGLRKRVTNALHSLQMLLAFVRLSLFCNSFQD